MTRRPWLLLAALWLVLGLVMAVWVSIDRRPAEWDHANHLERALHCHQILARPEHALREILDLSAFYPPLAICATGLAYFLFPVTPLTAQAVMWAFLGVGLASVFAIGRRLWDVDTGLLAALFLGTAPFVVFSLTNFQLDLPLAAMVALGLLALLRTEGFSRPGWAIACGAVMGLGMLTKPTFASYLVAPLGWALVSALRARDRKRRLGLLALSLAIAAALSLPWYGPRLVALPIQIADRSFAFAAAEGHARVLSVAGLLFYPRVSVPQMGALAMALALWGLWVLRRDARARGLIWTATLVPLVLYTLIQNKNLRYSLPILPAAALAAAAGARALPPRWRRGIVGAGLVLGLLQVWLAAFALPRPPHSELFGIPVVFYRPPSRGDWQHAAILADLSRESRGRPLTVAVVPNYILFSVSTFRYEALRRDLPLAFARPWEGVPFGVDLAVVKTGSQGPSFTAARPEGIMRAFAEDRYLAALYPVVREYPLPDGSIAAIRVRRPAPLEGVAPEAIARRLAEDPARTIAGLARDTAGLRVRLDYEPDAILAGRAKRVIVEATAARVGEPQRRDRALLPVRDVRVAIDDLLFDARRLVESGDLAVLDARAVRLERMTLLETDLHEFLRGQRAGRGVAVTLAEGAALVTLTRLGPAIAMRVGIGPPAANRPFVLAVENVRVGPLPVPASMVDWITRHFDPTLRLKRLRVAVSIAPIRVQPGRLEIGAPP